MDRKKPISLGQILAHAPFQETFRFGVTRPEVTLAPKGGLFSANYQDGYFNSEGGLAESTYVFLERNNFPDAWKDKSLYTIGELGFGTGLNFLLTKRLWESSQPAGALLHYYSYESHPLQGKDMRIALSAWPELTSELDLLIDMLPEPVIGTHRFFVSPNVVLNLVYGDVRVFLPLLRAQVDCWFLDGFAPARNPEMWELPLFEALVRASAPQARLSSYAVASEVQRSLRTVGFSLAKHKGFGRKREMLTGQLQVDQIEVQECVSSTRQTTEKRAPSVIILGAGLAGTALVLSFARRGLKVSLVERERAVAQHASGNPVGIIMPHLSVQPDTMSRFYLAGYCAFLRQLEEFRRLGIPTLGAECGALRLNSSERLQRVHDSLEKLGLDESFVRRFDSESATDLCGRIVARAGVFFQCGGWVSPPTICEANLLLAGSDFTRRFGRGVQQIRRLGDGLWQVSDTEGEVLATGEILVLANGYECLEFEETSWFPIEKVRGQILQVPENESSRSLSAVVCYDGYITPSVAGYHVVGATFDHHNESREASQEQSKELLARQAEWIPDVSLQYSESCRERVSFRTMSRDRLPFIGEVPELTEFQRLWQKEGRQAAVEQAKIPGLFTSVGHGSRGLISSHLAAEMVASLALHEPIPLESDLVSAVSAVRFPIRLARQEQEVSRESLAALQVKSPHSVVKESC